LKFLHETMKTIKLLPAILIFQSVIMLGCREKCGCEEDSDKTIHGHKAILDVLMLEEPVMRIDTDYVPYYGICNPEIIPLAIINAAVADSMKKQNVVIDAEIKPECGEIGPRIYINSIKKDTPLKK
jgi:hypothetical protein